MNIKLFIISISALALGVFIGTFLVHIPLFELDHKVDIVELANLTMLVVLSLAIPYAITSSLEDKRSEKDLLIAELEIFCEDLKKINEFVIDKKDSSTAMPDLIRLNYDFKRTRESLESFEEPLKALGSTKVNNCVVELNTKLEVYWEELTGNGGFGRLNNPVNAPFVWKQSITFNRLISIARKLKFCINRS